MKLSLLFVTTEAYSLFYMRYNSLEKYTCAIPFNLSDILTQKVYVFNYYMEENDQSQVHVVIGNVPRYTLTSLKFLKLIYFLMLPGWQLMSLNQHVSYKSSSLINALEQGRFLPWNSANGLNFCHQSKLFWNQKNIFAENNTKTSHTITKEVSI